MEFCIKTKLSLRFFISSWLLISGSSALKSPFAIFSADSDSCVIGFDRRRITRRHTKNSTSSPKKPIIKRFSCIFVTLSSTSRYIHVRLSVHPLCNGPKTTNERFLPLPILRRRLSLPDSRSSPSDASSLSSANDLRICASILVSLIPITPPPLHRIDVSEFL